MRGKENKSVKNNIKDVHYKEKQSQDDQMERRKEVETVDENELDNNRGDNVSFSVQHGDLSWESLDTIGPWLRFSEHEGEVGPNLHVQNPHRTDLTKLRPTNSVFYRTEPKEHEIEEAGRQRAPHEHHRAYTVGVDISNNICTKNGVMDTLLLQSQKS